LSAVLRGAVDSWSGAPGGPPRSGRAARHFVDAAAVSGATGLGIGGVGVDGSPARQHDGIVVVIKLTGEEERPGEAVVLGAVMAVVLVGRDRVPAEARVLRDVERQLVVMAEQDGLTVTGHHQLRRQRS